MVMWTSFRFHVDGGGVAQNPRASKMQSITAICFLETELLMRKGLQYVNDRREGFGDIQKVADDDSELIEDEEERWSMGKSNWEIKE